MVRRRCSDASLPLLWKASEQQSAAPLSLASVGLFWLQEGREDDSSGFGTGNNCLEQEAISVLHPSVSIQSGFQHSLIF